MTFQSLGLIEALLKAVRLQGYETPSPIQQKAIPPILEGLDVLASAQKEGYLYKWHFVFFQHNSRKRRIFVFNNGSW